MDVLCEPECERLQRLFPMQGEALLSRQRLSHLIAIRSDEDAISHERSFKDRFEYLLGKLQKTEDQLAAEIPEVAEHRRLSRLKSGDLAAQLHPGQVLLQFLRYHRANFHNVLERKEDYWLKPRYACFVLSPGGDIQLVDLGEAEKLDAVIATYRKRMYEGKDATNQREAARHVREAAIDPLHQALGDARSLIVIPHGQLAGIPLDILPQDDGMLVDHFTITLLPSARELFKSARGPTDDPVIMGAPDVSMVVGNPPQPVPVPPSVPRTFPWVSKLPAWLRKWLQPAVQRKISLALEIPGVRQPEISAGLEGTSGRWGTTDMNQDVEQAANDLGVEAHTGPRCLGAVLNAMHSPRVLYLAAPWFALDDEYEDPNQRTAGFMLDGARDRTSSKHAVENPLVRTGVALTGAQAIVERKSMGTNRYEGILTGLAVSGLDLAFTQAVVLPHHCGTVSGLQCGRNVVFLGHACLRAGARSVVMATGHVSVEARQCVMKEFHKGLKNGLTGARALAAAKDIARTALPDDCSWWNFMAFGL
jgi:hypothetical protein